MTTILPTSSTPRLSHRIRSVSVIGGFLDGLRLQLADGLNCFIGGRGTGKTTVLEFVRFALDALPGRDEDSDEFRRIESLVKQNLGGGRVQVEFQTKNGLRYLVSRSWGEEPLVLTTEGQPTQLTLKSGGVFRADIFSQNEVERIADRTTSQLVLIDKFQADTIAEIDSQLRTLKRELATSANELLSVAAKRVELREEVATLPEVEGRLKAFAGSGGEDADVINDAHARKAIRDLERYATGAIDDALWAYQEHLRLSVGGLESRAGTHLTEEILAGPNGEVLSEFAKQLAACGNAVDTLLEQAQDLLAQTRHRLEQLHTTLGTLHDQQEMAFRTLIEQHEVAMEQATERAHLERLRNDLLSKKRAIEEITSQLQTGRRQRDSLLERLSELRDKRFSIRQEVVRQINDKVSPMIRVCLEQFGDVAEYSRTLMEALTGAGIQHKLVANKIATSVPPRELSELTKNRDPQRLADQAGVNLAQATKVIEALRRHQVLLDLEVVDMKDRPRVELKDGDAYKDSFSLSTGQKCTSILPILLLDSDRPLLVDQPEDNLDNAFIYDTVVTRLSEVKADRQLILVTHNPNIPVLGDANKVFVFKSNGSKGWIEEEGTVDDCKGHIIDLLEGGEEAFKRRQKRYEY